ncbi:hypothetical protein RI129_009051 [Pyrocoelia pectoralis]|uniref:Lipase domain-containing protein n=1 Tax=Pyrocoelia pectoralis TaxID=417401 RepID=A0AAN7VFA0_9COLE
MSQMESLRNAQWYNPEKENYFIVHGWLNAYQSEVVTLIVSAVLQTNDFNVFVLDWSSIAMGLYSTSFLSVESIGLHLATFINEMIEEFQLNTRMFMLVGYSLGAHIAGCAGAGVNGLVRYIVGLDPAGPLFTLNNINNRLDVSDADFVQVIHTTAFFGFSSSIGHADYYPNDGTFPQPGCGLDAICAHARSYEFYAESVTTYGFTSLNCSSYRTYLEGQCGSQHVSYLGRIDIDSSAHGDYYLETNPRSPYSLT